MLAGRAEEALDDDTAARDPELARIVAAYSAADPDVRIVIVDADLGAAVVVSDPEDLDEDFTNRPEVATVLDTAQPDTGERFSTTLGYDLFYVAVPALSGDEVVGVVRFERARGDRVRAHQ